MYRPSILKLVSTFLPIIGAVVLVASVLWLNRIFFWKNAGGSGTLNQLNWLNYGDSRIELAGVKVREATARAVWGMAYLAQAVSFVGCIGFFFWVQYKVLATSTKRPAKWIVIASLLLSVLGGLWFFKEGRMAAVNSLSYSSLMRAGFLEEAVKSARAEEISPYIDAANGLMVMLCLAGIFAACSTLDDPDGILSGDPKFIKSRIKTLRNLLNVSAFALVVGVIQVNFEYRWAANLIVDKDPEKLSEPALAAAGSIILSTGGVLTLLLAATFIPAGVVLYHRVAQYNRTRSPWTSAISLDWREILGDALKVIAPILTAGPLASFIGK